MNTFLKVCIITSICLLLITQNAVAIWYTKLDFAHYVNLKTILPDYQKHSSAIDDNALILCFINIYTDQLMGFTFSKRWKTLDERQLTRCMHQYIKTKIKENFKEYKLKIVSFKTFDAHNQYIPYCIIDFYKADDLKLKGMFGIIRDYDSKHVIIYSYGPPSIFKEEEFISFFSEIEFKTDNFI